jgi:UTP--glucose-1-phosphate uridylyltransferase
MIPLLIKKKNRILIKPAIQLVFENLYDTGLREFCIVVGRKKRTIEDHFTPDRWFLRYLRSKGKNQELEDLEDFYSKLEKSSIVWVNQAESRGFGHAVSLARNYIHGHLIVHAGDTLLYSEENYIYSIMKEFRKNDSDCVLILKKVKDPKIYGVAEIKHSNSSMVVQRVVEKPRKPRTDLAVMPVYCLSHNIFDALANTAADKNHELQLTAAIQTLIDSGKIVRAVEMKNGKNIDVGSPQSYLESLTDLLGLNHYNKNTNRVDSPVHILRSF